MPDQTNSDGRLRVEIVTMNAAMIDDIVTIKRVFIICLLIF
jgi:hypothetical protein